MTYGHWLDATLGPISNAALAAKIADLRAVGWGGTLPLRRSAFISEPSVAVSRFRRGDSVPGPFRALLIGMAARELGRSSSGALSILKAGHIKDYVGGCGYFAVASESNPTLGDSWFRLHLAQSVLARRLDLGYLSDDQIDVLDASAANWIAHRDAAKLPPYWAILHKVIDMPAGFDVMKTFIDDWNAIARWRAGMEALAELPDVEGIGAY